MRRGQSAAFAAAYQDSQEMRSDSGATAKAARSASFFHLTENCAKRTKLKLLAHLRGESTGFSTGLSTFSVGKTTD